jgi:hypothetical protein
MQIALIRLASSIASEKGESSQFFVQLHSVQECSGPQFGASYSCMIDTIAFCQAEWALPSCVRSNVGHHWPHKRCQKSQCNQWMYAHGQRISSLNSAQMPP